MFNTMTGVKFIGGIGGALVIFLLLSMWSNVLFSESDGAEQAYVIDTGKSAPSAEATAVADKPDFNTLVAKADVAKGQKIFGKCKACHKLDKNAVGPHLGGVVGRPIASVADFKYSSALKGLGGDWTPDRLNEFLTKPNNYAPGTKMTFSGLKKIGDRADVVAYLKSVAQ